MKWFNKFKKIFSSKLHKTYQITKVTPAYEKPDNIRWEDPEGVTWDGDKEFLKLRAHLNWALWVSHGCPNNPWFHLGCGLKYIEGISYRHYRSAILAAIMKQVKEGIPLDGTGPEILPDVFIRLD